MFYSATVKRSTRRSLFYGLLAIFFVLGAGVVLYAEGLRLDLLTGQVSKIGAIFVRSFPDDASIYLGNEPVENQSDFLSRGTLISDLFPKTYALGLKAPGYDDWHENVSVLPSLVSTLKYAVLVPASGTIVASGTANAFFVAPGTMTLTTASATIVSNGKSIGKGDLLNATLDRSAFIFKNPNGGYYLYDTQGGVMTDLSSMLLADGIASSSISGITIDPYDPTEAIVSGQKRIWLLDVPQGGVTQIEKVPANGTIGPSIAVSNASIAWTRETSSSTSEIVLYDQYTQTIADTSTTVPGTNRKLEWINGDGLLGVLQTDGSLYLYDASAEKLQKLADDAVDLSATQDGTMVASLEHSSIEIFSLNDPAGYYRFNLPDIGTIKALIWYKDNNHLFVVYPDHVSFLDLADSGLANFTTVAAGTSPIYDASADSSLYDRTEWNDRSL